MKGVIFTLFEKFVVEHWGEDALDDILEASTGVEDDAFVAVETYPDAWLLELLGHACEQHGLDAPTALRTVGRWAFAHLVGVHEGFVAGITHPKPFLLSVHGVIHVEVHKLMPGARTPSVLCTDTGAHSLRMEYRSSREMCPFAEGLIEGCADYFGVPTTVEHVACTHRGDTTCLMELTFAEPWKQVA